MLQLVEKYEKFNETKNREICVNVATKAQTFISENTFEIPIVDRIQGVMIYNDCFACKSQKVDGKKICKGCYSCYSCVSLSQYRIGKGILFF